MESKMNGNRDIMYLLRVLEEEINNSKKAMFGGKVIDDNKLLAIISDIRFNLPQALSHANAVIRDRDKILMDAKERSERMIQDATDKANTLIDNHEIVAKAHEEADYIVANAKSYADMITNETLESIDDMLRRSEDNFADILDVVRNSRDDVNSMRKQDARVPNASAGKSDTRNDIDMPQSDYAYERRGGMESRDRANSYYDSKQY